MTPIARCSPPNVPDPVDEKQEGRPARRSRPSIEGRRASSPDRLAQLRGCAEVDVLERLGVPYLVVQTDGVPLITSRRVPELFTVEADLRAVTAQIRRLALTVRRKRSMTSLPSCRGEMQLTGVLLAPWRGKRVVLVVLSPSKRAAVARTTLDATGLTAREQEVAWLLTEGRTSRAIAEALGISAHTARHHTEKIFAKLGVQSRAEAAAVMGRFSSGSATHPVVGTDRRVAADGAPRRRSVVGRDRRR